MSLKENLLKKSAVVNPPEEKSEPPAAVSSKMIPTEFCVEVDGEEFNVKVSPIFSDENVQPNPGTNSLSQNSSTPSEIPEGAMISGMAGLIVSIKVDVGDKVEEGDEIAVS